MLVLSRKEGESLIIKTPSNEVIKVTLTRYQGQSTSVGIDAPDDYTIVREELAEVSNETK